ADHPGFEVPLSIREKTFPDFYRNLLVEVEGGIATVTIRRPEVLNALNEQTMLELRRMFVELEADDAVSGIVLTSYDGSIAGADIMELAVLETADAAIEKCRRGHEVLSVISALRKPVVAAVDGPVLGGGSELAMACHARVVGHRLMIGQPEVNLGIIPGYGGTQRLPRLVGVEAALGMLRSGQPIGAEEACRLGWATGMPANDVVSAARVLIERHLSGELSLASVDPGSMALPDELPVVDIGHRSLTIDSILLDAIREGITRSLAEGLEVEAAAFGRCRETVDYDIGMKNFIQNGPRVPAVFMNE
ncbi:enoyl-CoA hydratase/isomerase family protein, partial [Candidatus Zixiibacteriota bacterium]